MSLGASEASGKESHLHFWSSQLTALHQGIKAGDLIYLSGFTGLNPETKQLAGETIEERSEPSNSANRLLKSAGRVFQTSYR